MVGVDRYAQNPFDSPLPGHPSATTAGSTSGGEKLVLTKEPSAVRIAMNSSIGG